MASQTWSPATTTWALGTTSVSLTGVDGSGNIETCTTTVTVNDVTNPTVTCDSAVLQAGPTCTADLDPTATADDNCSVASLTRTPTNTTWNLGANPVSWLAVDGSANIASCNATITVLDVTPPAVTCQGGTAEVGPGCVGTFTPTGASTDNCSVASETWSPATSTWPMGANSVTLTAVDGSGNVGTCSTTVTVVDTTPPEIQCNSLATITPPDAPISFKATSTDNCATTTVITGYDCWMLNGKGKRVDKTGSCVVSYSGDTVTITDSGGVKDNIEWTVQATDANGNVTTKTCALLVTNPGQGGTKGKCDQGVGDGPEGCDPGNSNQGDDENSNDEKGGTPGNPGKKGGKK